MKKHYDEILRHEIYSPIMKPQIKLLLRMFLSFHADDLFLNDTAKKIYVVVFDLCSVALCSVTNEISDSETVLFC